jgi:CrcB protein
MSWLTLIAVGLGGSAGALARSIVGPYVQRRAQSAYPVGTLVINIISCFIAGVLLHVQIGGALGAMLVVGFLGGFSTLSTVVFESIEFMFHGHAREGIANLFLTYICALAAAAAGFFIA